MTSFSGLHLRRGAEVAARCLDGSNAFRQVSTQHNGRQCTLKHAPTYAIISGGKEQSEALHASLHELHVQAVCERLGHVVLAVQKQTKQSIELDSRHKTVAVRGRGAAHVRIRVGETGDERCIWAGEDGSDPAHERLLIGWARRLQVQNAKQQANQHPVSQQPPEMCLQCVTYSAVVAQAGGAPEGCLDACNSQKESVSHPVQTSHPRPYAYITWSNAKHDLDVQASFASRVRGHVGAHHDGDLVLDVVLLQVRGKVTWRVVLHDTPHTNKHTTTRV